MSPRQGRNDNEKCRDRFSRGIHPSVQSCGRRGGRIIYGGPIGGTDIRNAYLPPIPGLYGGIADVPGTFTQLNGNNGGKEHVASPLNFESNTVAAGLLYVYPFKILGASAATSAQVGYLDYSRFSLDGVTQRSAGWTDMYSDIFKLSRFLGQAAAFSAGRRPLPYGLTVEAAYSMIFPIGDYQALHSVTPGHNDYFITPNVAATYLTRPNFLGDGVEFSGHLFYNHALENTYDHYRDGDVIDLDWGITERDGRIQYGATGFAAFQIGRDAQNGVAVPPEGKYFNAVKIGPIVAYDFPHLGLSLKAKALFSGYIKNTVFGPTFVLSAGFKL